MLQVNNIRENKQEFINALKKRNFEAEDILEEVLQLDEKRRATQVKLDDILAESNRLSKEIGMMFKNGEQQKANLIKEKTGNLKEDSKALSEKLSETVAKLETLLYTIPNVPHESVPAGTSEDDNEEIFKEGDVPVLAEGSLPHWELAKKYDIIDFELGNKEL